MYVRRVRETLVSARDRAAAIDDNEHVPVRIPISHRRQDCRRIRVLVYNRYVQLSSLTQQHISRDRIRARSHDGTSVLTAALDQKSRRPNEGTTTNTQREMENGFITNQKNRVLSRVCVVGREFVLVRTDVIGHSDVAIAFCVQDRGR